MNKITLFLLLVAIFSGCSNYMNKSIFEPLALDEIQRQIKKDSLFEDIYNEIQKINEDRLTSNIEKAKYSDLTYKRVSNAIHLYNDTSIINYCVKKWNLIYGNDVRKVDSVVAYWKKEMDENSLSRFVKIEPVSIETEYYSFGGVDEVSIGFKLTPIKGEIEQIRFGYCIEPKIDEGSNKYKSMSWCITTTPFSKPTIRYWEANYSNENLLAGKTLKSALRDYNFYFEIDKIRMNGENMSADDFILPHSIDMYIEYGSLYEEEVIKEFINIGYVDMFTYYKNHIDSVLYKNDKLAKEYLNVKK